MSAPASEPETELAGYRASIDNLDSALVHILAERFRCTRLVGELKARAGLLPADLGREETQAARLRKLAGGAGLDPDFAERVFRLVVEEVKRNHHAIRSERL